jgi:hypothetical protein
MAQMKVDSAQINVNNAQLILDDVEQRGRAAAEKMNRGGVVYANRGIFVPRGTDTVPAMLTPGEFVVNRNSVNRGNNLQILKAMNDGANAVPMRTGGRVSYYSNGSEGRVPQGSQGQGGSSVAIDPAVVSGLTEALNNFNTKLETNIKNLQNTKFQIQLDQVNVNVNLSGGSFLQGLKDQIQKDVLTKVGDEIKTYKVVEGGRLQKSSSVV